VENPYIAWNSSVGWENGDAGLRSTQLEGVRHEVPQTVRHQKQARYSHGRRRDHRVEQAIGPWVEDTAGQGDEGRL
jgi:hypothetical protein